MDLLLSPIVIAVLVTLAALVLVALLYTRNYIKVPANQVAVFTGRGQQKIVRGGGRFKMPIIERVDIMSLEPFNVQVAAENVYSKDGVPVTVTGVGLVKFGSSEEDIATAVERFLTADRNALHTQVTEIMGGNMRSIVSQMTVEELNSKRDELTKRVVEEAASSFKPIGMLLDVLTIQSISDRNGYLDALGRTRIAEVHRDAEIGEANAKRDAMIQSAQAEQEGKTAQAQATTAIAQAERERDIELARIKAIVSGEQAKAEQSGPLAEAQARKAVVVAEAEVERERETAQIAVEEQRGLRAEQAQRADVIVPAEAKKTAAIIEAEGNKASTIANAEADAERRRLEGEGESQARQSLAEAKQTEMEAEAAGNEAKLLAEAKGQEALAAALNALTPEAAHQRVLPALIEAMPEIINGIAAQIGQIDRLVVIDGGNGSGDGGGGDMASRLVSLVPIAIAQGIETMRAVTGIDLAETMGKNDASSNGHTPAAAAPQPAVEAAPVE